jgi:hypothetical protein
MSARVLDEQLTTVRVLRDAIIALPIPQLMRALQTEEATSPWIVKAFTPADRHAITVLAEAQRQLTPPTISEATNGNKA